jgi:putative ABC transport system ATP-binding protein
LTSVLPIAAEASADTLVQPDVPVPLVRICGVSKTYSRGGQCVPVLNDVTFNIADGKFLGLMGPSGSGKSTLLNLIAAIDRPDRGRIIVNGSDITGLSEAKLADWRAASIGFIFQFYNLLPALTAEENVELPLLLTPLSRRERREHVAHALALVGLTDRQRHYPFQLSGGQQQRIAIARAIVTNPVLLVADEPTGDLDRRSAADILTLLETLNYELGLTIVMVTHDPRAAERADAVIHLEKGQLYRDYEHTRSGQRFAQLSCNY